MKVIFLDIDGVLNSEESMRELGMGNFWSDNPHPMHIRWLNKIIEETGAVVVISSTWRHGMSSTNMWRLLHLLGFRGTVIDNTPRLNSAFRGTEIKAWLNIHIDKFIKYGNSDSLASHNCKEQVESFVILDDDSDMLDLTSHLVLVDSLKGLTEEDANKAIEILNFQ